MEASNASLAAFAVWPSLSEVKVIARHQDVVSGSNARSDIHQITDGWAARVAIRHDGQRQFLGILRAGDFCDLDAVFSGQREFAVVSLTKVIARRVSRPRLRGLIARHPEVLKPLPSVWFQDVSWLRRLAVQLRRGSAIERIAFILCHITTTDAEEQSRCRRRFSLLLTQEHSADLAGVTAVHANRVMVNLRRSKIINYGARFLEMIDPARLRKMAGLRIPVVGRP